MPHKGRAFAILSLLAMLLAAGCAASGRSPAAPLRFTSGLVLGEISGPEGAALAAELSRRVSRLKDFGRQTTLSGEADLEMRQGQGNENVLVRTPGAPYEQLEPDIFTGQVWRVTKSDSTARAEERTRQDISGVMNFNWRLTDGGRTVISGRIVQSAGRSFGAMTGSGVRSAAQLDKAARDLEAELVKSVADQMVMLFGREPEPGEIDSGLDPESGRARRLALSGDWAGAQDVWRALVELNPNYGPALYNLGLCQERLGDLQSARAYFRSAFLNGAQDNSRQALTRVSKALGEEEAGQ